MTRVKDIVDFIYEVLPKTANIFVCKKISIYSTKKNNIHKKDPSIYEPT